MSLDLKALETSFDLVAPRGDELMDDFYARLFTAAPSVRSLFPTDMKAQKTMLLSALVLLRKSLRNLDGIVPTLHELGALAHRSDLCVAGGRSSWRPGARHP